MNPILPMVVFKTDRKRYLGRKRNNYLIRSRDVKLRSETINSGIKYPLTPLSDISGTSEKSIGSRNSTYI